jgi:hypothetical protein
MPKESVMLFNKFRLSPFFFYQSNNDGGNQGGDNSQGEPGDNETFESWLDSQPDEVKSKAKPLYEAHVNSLKSTVKATRTERDDLSKQLKKLSKDLEEGSEAKKSLDKVTADLEAANTRADFYEEAPAHNCRNPKAAYAILRSNNLYDSRNNIDWKALQQEAPELFGEKKKVIQKKTAGNGTDDAEQSNSSMNNFIRKKAGYGEITQEA